MLSRPGKENGALAVEQTMVKQNDQDDSLVFEAISQGYDRAALIEVHAQLGDNATRRVDRSLQRLRRAKRIEFAGPGTRRWRIRET